MHRQNATHAGAHQINSGVHSSHLRFDAFPDEFLQVVQIDRHRIVLVVGKGVGFTATTVIHGDDSAVLHLIGHGEQRRKHVLGFQQTWQADEDGRIVWRACFGVRQSTSMWIVLERIDRSGFSHGGEQSVVWALNRVFVATR